MFRVQDTLPNMGICPNIAINTVYRFPYFVLIFQLFSLCFVLLVLYLDMDPEHSLFNIMTTANIVLILSVFFAYLATILHNLLALFYF